MSERCLVVPPLGLRAVRLVVRADPLVVARPRQVGPLEVRQLLFGQRDDPFAGARTLILLQQAPVDVGGRALDLVGVGVRSLLAVLVLQTGDDRDAGCLHGGLGNPGRDEVVSVATSRLRVSRVDSPGVWEQSGTHNASWRDAPARLTGRPGQGGALSASVRLALYWSVRDVGRAELRVIQCFGGGF